MLVEAILMQVWTAALFANVVYLIPAGLFAIIRRGGFAALYLLVIFFAEYLFGVLSGLTFFVFCGGAIWSIMALANRPGGNPPEAPERRALPMPASGLGALLALCGLGLAGLVLARQATPDAPNAPAPKSAATDAAWSIWTERQNVEFFEPLVRSRRVAARCGGQMVDPAIDAQAALVSVIWRQPAAEAQIALMDSRLDSRWPDCSKVDFREPGLRAMVRLAPPAKPAAKR